MPKRLDDDVATLPSSSEDIDVSDPSVLRIDLVDSGADTDGWVHTHGLQALGLPELEIRGVAPRFLMPAAAMLLSNIADYMVNGGRRVAVGDAMVLDELTFVRVARAEPIPGEADHYQHERWTVLEVPESCCPLCDDSVEHDRVATTSRSDLLN
jgi:hypothetical protein